MKNLIREIRRAKNLTLQQLATAVDTTHQQILRLERGERRLTTEWMARIAPALGVTPHDLLPPVTEAKQESYNRAAEVYAAAQEMLPIHPLSPTVGAGPWRIGSQIVDRAPGLTSLRGVGDAYAIFTPDSRMEPRLMAGTVLLLHPHRPVRPSQCCLVYFSDDSVMLAQFSQFYGDRVDFVVDGNRTPFSSNRSEIRVIHPVVAIVEI